MRNTSKAKSYNILH